MQEAYISLSFKIVNPKGVEVMVTMRESEGAESDKRCFERVNGFIERATEKNWQAVTVKGQSQPNAQIIQHPSAPPTTATQSNGNTFHATKLKVAFTEDGKKKGKMFGGKFTQYGVTLWPEVAGQLGFKLDEMAPGDYPVDMLVTYSLNDKQQPQKVTGRAA